MHCKSPSPENKTIAFKRKSLKYIPLLVLINFTCLAQQIVWVVVWVRLLHRAYLFWAWTRGADSSIPLDRDGEILLCPHEKARHTVPPPPPPTGKILATPLYTSNAYIMSNFSFHLKCTCAPNKYVDMWKGHSLEVHCTNIEKKFIE